MFGELELEDDRDGGEELVEGLWSHTPPRLRDALGEEDQVFGGLLEEEEVEVEEVRGWEEGVGGGGEDVGAVAVVGEVGGEEFGSGGVGGGGKHQETKVEVVEPPLLGLGMEEVVSSS